MGRISQASSSECPKGSSVGLQWLILLSRSFTGQDGSLHPLRQKINSFLRTEGAPDDDGGKEEEHFLILGWHLPLRRLTGLQITALLGQRPPDHFCRLRLRFSFLAADKTFDISILFISFHFSSFHFILFPRLGLKSRSPFSNRFWVPLLQWPRVDALIHFNIG